MRFAILRIAVLAGFLAAPGFALDPDLRVTQFVQNTWRAPQSLPHDDVTSIVQARDGYLWIGTVEGLVRFDGVRSVVFDKTNTPELTNNWIKALLEDRRGRLWIGTLGGGLVCREGGRFVRIGESRGFPYDVVTAIAEDRRGRIWVGTTEGGFLCFENGGFRREPGTEAAAKTSVRAILEDRAGALWIGTETGLYRFAGGVLTRFGRESGLTDEGAISLASDAEGLWIGTETGGLNRLSGGRFTAITVKEGLSHTRVWCLATDRDGNLWIGTDGGGLDRLSRGQLTVFSTKNGLTNDYVWAIREDREGSLWIGTNGGGLNRLKNPRVVPWTTREGLPSDFIWTIRRARDGTLWMGTDDAGLVRMRGGSVTAFGARAGLSGNAKALVERADGSLWIGGNAGLSMWKDGRVRIAVPIGDSVDCMVQDREGALWMGTNSHGLRRWKDGRLETFTRDNGLSGDSITSLLAARDGKLWVATIGGLDWIEGGTIHTRTKADGLPSAYVTSIFEAPDGAVWAGTKSGLVRVRGGRVGVVNSQQGLLDDAIVVAILADDGSVWTGTNRGLFRTPLRQLADVADGRRSRVLSTAFGLDEGMKNVEVNGSAGGGWKDPDGRLWFATRGGIVSIDPARLARNKLAPPVVIEEAVADEEPLPSAGGWRLPPGLRRLDFHYTATSLLSPAATVFRRRLEGFDPDWVDAGRDRDATYTNLPPGRYRFQVAAANSDGFWNEEGASVAFVVEPRFHERLWFRALVVLSFAVVGPLFYFVRVRRLDRQRNRLEQLVAQRTAEVRAANDRLAQLAREDGLTGVANRRRLDEALDEEWRRAIRQASPLSLLLFDLDFFKSYNDRLGHIAGDECLKAVARTATELCHRAGEVVARWGGEEFAVLLPHVSESEARAVAERLRAAIEASGIPHPGSPVAPVVTVSVGAASTHPLAGKESTAADLVAATDRALYRAKESGRNRVETESSWPPASPVPPA
jgi:diguanylate cyclase (GGDEF)-like protein